MTRRSPAIVALAVLSIAACTGGSGANTNATTTTHRATTPSSGASVPKSGGFEPQPVEWTSCGKTLKCATLDVPVDYDNPTGPTIQLSLNERPADNPDERVGVMLVNPGGPGGSGLEFVSGGIALPSSVLDRFDIVGFDPRGIGESSPLNCGAATVPPFRHVDAQPDSPDEEAALEGAAQAVADDCGTNAGALLGHMGTDDVARDMDTIRIALGQDQINYLGVSYGTLLGLRYAALFAPRIRAMVLDGIDQPQSLTDWLRGQTTAFEQQIDGVLAQCPDGKAGCPQGGAAAAYDQVSTMVEASPLPAGKSGELGPSELALAALLPTYDPSLNSVFFKGLSDALAGNGGRLKSLSDAYLSSVNFVGYAAVECTDSSHPVGAEAYAAFAHELEAISPRFGGSIANELLPCAFWPAPVHDITAPVTAPDAPPILVVGNTGDAATPYQQAVDVAKTLAHGRLLTFDSTGHAAYGRSQCAAAAEAAYFTDLTLPDDGTVCTD